MYRILQTGTSNSLNKGDAAIEVSAACALKAAIDGVEITISTPSPSFDGPFYAPVPVVPSLRRHLLKSTLHLAGATLWGRLKRHFDIDARWLIRAPELRATADADLVVDLSGDMLTEDYGPRTAYSHYLPLLYAWAMGVPYAICAQSVGPFHLTRGIAQKLLENAHIITARDPITYDYLRDLGLNDGRLHLTADIAFLLNPSPAAHTAQLRVEERLPPKGTALLGVSLSDLIRTHYDRWNPHASSTPFWDMFAQRLDHFCVQHGYEVLFIPHVTGPTTTKDDRYAGRMLQKKMATTVHLIEGDRRPEELKALIAECTLFMGARMHANIGALGTCVPTLAIAYSHKTPGIMAMFQQSERVLHIRDITPESLEEKLTALHRDREAVRQKLDEAIPDVRQRAGKNIALILELLQNQSQRRHPETSTVKP